MPNPYRNLLLFSLLLTAIGSPSLGCGPSATATPALTPTGTDRKLPGPATEPDTTKSAVFGYPETRG